MYTIKYRIRTLDRYHMRALGCMHGDGIYIYIYMNYYYIYIIYIYINTIRIRTIGVYNITSEIMSKNDITKFT